MTSSARLQQEAAAARSGLSSALDDLKSSVTTTALTEGAMTFAKQGSNAVARAAVDRAMANPLAAMLIGAGLVMLMSSAKSTGAGSSGIGGAVAKGNEGIRHAASAIGSMGSRLASAAGDSYDATREATGSVLDTAKDAASRASATASDAASTAYGRASDAVSGAYGRASDALSDAYNKASDTASGAYDKASDAASNAYGRASDAASGAYDKAKDALAKGQDQGQQALANAQQLATQAQTRLESFAQEQPVLVAALGLAFGAAIGASLPISEAERKYMGSTGKAAADKGIDIAKKAADQVTGALAGSDVPAKVGELANAVSSTVTQGLSKSTQSQG